MVVSQRHQIFVVGLLLTAIALFACGQGNISTTCTANDNHYLLSKSGVSVRAFDENGIPVANPSEKYNLEVNSTGDSRLVVVSLKSQMSVSSNYLEVQFDGTREHPSEIRCGSALLSRNPLVYMGSPEAGKVICAQVIPGDKHYEVNGSLLQIQLSSGKHQVRSVSDFKQDPSSDPIIANPIVDSIDKNKISWTFKLRGEGNNNQIYDFADFGVIGAKYGKLSTDTGCEVADADGKGKVDFADFGVVGANYNKGIGGLSVFRDDNSDPTTKLGLLDTGGKIKGDFTIDKSANLILPSGFKQYWHTFGSTGRYIKLVLINQAGVENTKFFSIIDTGAKGETGARGDWWMNGREPTHNRRSPFNGPSTNAIKWSFKATHWVVTSPAIDSEGNLYFGVMDLGTGGTDSYFYSVNSSGVENWKYLAPDWIGSSPALGEDGTIYFGCNDNNLYALYHNGVVKWVFKTKDDIRSSPAIGSDGTIYFGSNDKNLYALNPDGTQKWVFAASDLVVSCPAIGNDGSIYFGSNDTNLYALNSDGTKKWSYKTDGIVFSSPAIGSDGTLYFGSMDKNLYALKPEGSLKWTYLATGSISASPAIAADGSIFVGDWDSKFYGINPDGSLKWNYSSTDYFSTSPAIGADGIIYVGSNDSNFYAFKPDGSVNWSYKIGGMVSSATAIGGDGTVYFGSVDTNLYAIGPGEIISKPNPPENVQASDALDVDLIDIAWSAPVSGVKPDAYKVYRSKTKTGTYSLIASLWDTLDYTDDTVTDTEVYWYKITALKSGVESDPSSADDGRRHQSGPGDWAMFGREPTQNRRSPFIGPATNTIKWSFQIPKNKANEQPRFIGTSPTLGIDGSVYIGAEFGDLFALRANGINKWATNLESTILYSSPAIATDGTIYNGSNAHKLFALTSKSIKWTVIGSESNSADAWIKPSPIIGGDGTVYYGDRVGKFYAVSSDGKEQWKFDAYSEIYSTAAISAEGTIYFGDSNAHFFAVNQDGSKKWEYDMPGTMITSPAIASDGTIYTASSSGKLVAFNPDSTIKWEFPAIGNIGSIWGSPAIDADGTVYIGSDDKKLYAINPDGTFKWEFLTGNKIGSRAPAIDAKGNIYFCSWDKKIYAVSPEGKEIWSFESSNYSDGSPVIGEDGSIYYAGWDGILYAIGPGSGKSGLSAPTSVSASDGTDKDKIVISWQAPTTGPVPDGYYVYHSLSDKGIWQYIGKSTTTSFNDSYGISGKTYYYKVQSYKYASGYNDSSDSAIDSGARK